VRKTIPLVGPPGAGPQGSAGMKVYQFMKATPATSFFAGPPMPAGQPVAAVRW